MTQVREQVDAASRPVISEADIDRYIKRMNVVRHGETKLAVALQCLDRDVDLVIPMKADRATTAARQE